MIAVFHQLEDAYRHGHNRERAQPVGKILYHRELKTSVQMLLYGPKMTEQTWSLCFHSRYLLTGNINSDEQNIPSNFSVRKDILLLYEPDINIRNNPIFNKGL